MTTANAGQRPAPVLDMKIFITGANGFIGKAMAERFRTLGARVSGMDLVADPDNDIVAGDVTEPERWAHALDGVDVVIHTAALLGAAHPRERSWHVNVLGTHKVLRAAIAAGVARFVQFSSVAAYGFDFPADVAEQYPIAVNGDIYTDTKVNGEAVVLAAHAAGEIDVTVVRPHDVWGPRSVWVVAPVTESRKATGFPLPDGGRGIFSPVYIDNFVDGMVLIVSSDKAIGQVFNLGDGYGVPCSEYFGRIAEMCGGRIRTLPIGIAATLADAIRTTLRKLGRKSDLSAGTMYLLNRPATYSNDKIQTMLGHRPLVSMDEGMARVEEWLRSEGLAAQR
ncbi:MAG TPA: NAD-dependent epimerase/dehydratase family protein [Aldersonia sp.]